MKLSLLAAVSVATLAFASAAWADNNVVYLNQYNSNQSATIDQSGSSGYIP